MKVHEECAHCGKPHKTKVTLTLKDSDREQFMSFVNIVQQGGFQGTLPPSKYPKHPILIPAPGQNPCPMCKHGMDNIGPNGCGRGKSCIAYLYYVAQRVTDNTSADPITALKEFTCAVPSASWLSPMKKREAARSVELPFDLTSKTSSGRAGSSKSAASRKSKWRSSSKPPSARMKTRSRKQASAVTRQANSSSLTTVRRKKSKTSK